MTGDPAILVLHDIGSAAAGQPWRAALASVGWAGPVLVPDLPGHLQEPAPASGTYEMVDAALFALRVLHEAQIDEPTVVVGVGGNVWSALVLALGGRAGCLALVQPPDATPLPPRVWADEHRAWLRRVADDPAALAPPPGGGELDPRLRHGLVPPVNPDLERGLCTLSIPWCRIDDDDPQTAAGTLATWVNEVAGGA